LSQKLLIKATKNWKIIRFNITIFYQFIIIVVISIKKIDFLGKSWKDGFKIDNYVYYIIQLYKDMNLLY